MTKGRAESGDGGRGATRDPRNEGTTTARELPAWTMEELWQREQVNSASHLAIMFKYLQALGIRFTRTALGDGRNQIVLERIA